MKTVSTAEIVYVPAVGRDVQVRRIPPKLLRVIQAKVAKDGGFDFNELMVQKLVLGLVDPNFTEDEAREIVYRFTAGALRPVVDRIDELSGTDEHLDDEVDHSVAPKLIEPVTIATAWLQRFPTAAPRGRAPRSATNVRRKGSRRTTGSGSTSSGEDGDPELRPRRCKACGADISHRIKPGPGRKPERCAKCRILRRRATKRASQRKQRRKELHAEIVASPERFGLAPAAPQLGPSGPSGPRPLSASGPLSAGDPRLDWDVSLVQEGEDVDEHGIAHDLDLQAEKVHLGYHPPNPLMLSMGSRLTGSADRPGLEALRGAVGQSRLDVDVSRDGWVTIRPSGVGGRVEQRFGGKA